MDNKKSINKLPQKQFKPQRPSRWFNILGLVVGFFILVWMLEDLGSGRFMYKTIPYSEFKQRLKAGEVVSINIKPTEIIGRIIPRTTEGASEADTQKGFLFRTVKVDDPDLIKELETQNVEFTATQPSAVGQFLLSWILPLGLLVGLWVFLARRMESSGQSVLSFGKSRARFVMDKDTGVKFDDVAGCDEAKQELQEVVDFLKNPAKYEILGARIPKGVLLVGPPGTGKTLLARAVAGEAKVPFFSISGSDFMEMFVGVGAARVRDLFEQAKQHAPAIIFIDELDAIGKQRTVGISPGHDERDQTLNALLVEMDGFEPNLGIVVLAATNRPEILDRALLRPGRFDRQIVVDVPDVEGRKAILRVHIKNKPLAPDVDLEKIATATAGFTGADLANLVNEAALLAARRGASQISHQDLESAMEKVVAGPERRSRHLSPEVKRRVAVHETGHAIVATFCPGAPPVRKVSIVPRGAAALGYTLQVPKEDIYLLTRSELLDRVRTLLGGRAAEELLFGEISTGAENDLDQATTLVRQMVAIYGMSERVGLVHYGQRRPLYMRLDQAEIEEACSEQTVREIDEEVRRIMSECYKDALEILKTRRKALERISEELLRIETLEQENFLNLLNQTTDEELNHQLRNEDSSFAHQLSFQENNLTKIRR